MTAAIITRLICLSKYPPDRRCVSEREARRSGIEEKRSPNIRIWIGGPHLLFNQAVRALLAGLPGIELTGTSKGPGILPRTQTTVNLNIVLLALPEPTDFISITDFCQQHPQTRVLLLSLDWTLSKVQTSLQAGVSGCLSANMSAEDLGNALRQAVRGEITLSRELQKSLIMMLAEGKQAESLSFEDLSPREREVLILVCEGLSNKQIAQRIYLSVRTVENHLANIYTKLEVESRTEAAVFALQQGWIPTN